MSEHHTIFGPCPWGVPATPLTRRQRLVFLWLDFRCWLEEVTA
jgi:hypothetical protein